MNRSNTKKSQVYINDVLGIALNHSANQRQDPFRPIWHFAPQFGLLNDPNGLAFFNGEYHLFYQWNPKACAHGAKAWGHATSCDMIHWNHQPLALAPVEAYETHGCYSGSGLVVDGRLELFYTGNVKFADGGRTAYQCRASLMADGQVEKQGIVLELPQGYSGHVRDPKVWEHQGEYYMVLGAEDLDYKGKVLLYRSIDLEQWGFVSEIFGHGINGHQSDDFMLECPDFFPLHEKYVLISCPKNWIDMEGKKTETFDVMVHIGDFDYQQGHFEYDTGTVLDYGFDFYAPQTFVDESGRRILFGWMGKPDEFESYQPTTKYGWIHQMTCARELSIEDGKLYQKPVSEIQALRENEQHITGKDITLYGSSVELFINTLQLPQLRIEIADDLIFEIDENGVKTWRKNLKTAQWEYNLWQGEVVSVHILRDASCVEIFINQGEAVSSSRFFATRYEQGRCVGFKIQSTTEVSAIYWQLNA